MKHISIIYKSFLNKKDLASTYQMHLYLILLMNLIFILVSMLIYINLFYFLAETLGSIYKHLKFQVTCK